MLGVVAFIHKFGQEAESVENLVMAYYIWFVLKKDLCPYCGLCGNVSA